MDWPPGKLMFWCVFNSLCSAFQVGYHLSVLNIPQQIFEDFTNCTYRVHYGEYMSASGLNSMWAFVVTMYSLGAVFGACLTNQIAERFGRKTSIMLWNNILVIVGSVLMGAAKAANSFELLTVGRFIIGVASGLSTGLLALYLTECCPTRWRGLTGSLLNFFITSTTLWSTVTSLPQLLGTYDLWPYLIGLGIIPAVVQMLFTPLCPESPKYLCVTLNDKVRAIDAVRYYHGSSADIDAVLREFEQEKLLSEREVGFREAFRDRNLRWAIFVASVVNFAMVFTGIIAIFSYSTEIFQSVNLGTEFATYSTTIMSACNTVGAVLGLFIIERFPRRWLFLGGMLFCVGLNVIFLIFSLIAQAHSVTKPDGDVVTDPNYVYASWICLIALLLFVTVFNMGPGPIAWFVSAEMTPQAARSVGASVTLTVNWLMSVITSLVYPPLQTAGNSWSFMLFIVPCVVCAVFLFFKMPETRNRTIEQVMESWMSPEEIAILQEKTKYATNSNDSVSNVSSVFGEITKM